MGLAIEKKDGKQMCGTPILPYLYLGDEKDAADPVKLKGNNIYYVLNVTTDLPGEGEKDCIRYKRIPAKDSFDQNLAQYFEEAFTFIEEARKNGRNILIHCHAGISRSPTIVVAYLIHSQKMPFNKAYKFVESRRPIISPNFSFVGQLYEYGEAQVKSMMTSPSMKNCLRLNQCNNNIINSISNSKQQQSTKEGVKLDLISSLPPVSALNLASSPNPCEALTDIPINSLGPVRGCRSRKSLNNDFTLLRPIKMQKNARVK